MSIAAMKAVFDHSATRNGARLVMLALADVADDEGVVVYADYSLGDIAAKCNLSERQVTTIIAAIEGGELAVERGTGRGNTHQYKILLPGLELAPHRRRKGEKTSPFTKEPTELAEKGEVFAEKGEVSSIKGEVFSGPLRKDHSTNYQTPLPPSSPLGGAACLPEGQAAPPERALPVSGLRVSGLPVLGLHDEARSEATPCKPPSGPISEIDRFRDLVRAAFGETWFRSWFETVAINPPNSGAGTDREPGRGMLIFETGSDLIADRLANSAAPQLAALWADIAGGAPPRVKARVCPAMKIALDARRATAREAAGNASADAGRADARRAARSARGGRR